MYRSILMALIAMAAVLPARLVAEVKMETVEYKDGNVTCKGWLSVDSAKTGARPGVLIVPEWWGINDYVKGRAKQIAELGYAAFVVDMYGDAKVTIDPKQAGEWAGPLLNDRDAMRSRVMSALAAFKGASAAGGSMPGVLDEQKIAAIGYCFGGTTALELARGGADITGVVAFHAGLTAPKPADSIKPKILVCAGADDPMVPADQRAAFEKEMKAAKANFQINIYSGAIHAFTNPGADSYHVAGVGYNAQADQRSWNAMKDFFVEIFK